MDWDHMELKETEKGTETEFFFNQPMNVLLLHSFKRYFGVKGYKTLDHDHTKIFTNKPDAKACYKGKGYYASFFSADQIPLYVSMQRDRKSTRLNSSHVAISYAVFCLKKKTKHNEGTH